MSLEYRTGANGGTYGPYYYSKYRLADGRVVSTYYGAGVIARTMARLDARAAQKRREERLLEEHEQRQLDTLTEQVDVFREHLRAYKRLHLLATNHRTHKGQWRRKRSAIESGGGNVTALPVKPNQQMSDDMMPEMRRSELRDLRRLSSRVNTENPDPADVVALRQALKETPGAWKRLADLARGARETLIESFPASESQKVALRRGIWEMCESLGWETAPALERMMIEEVVLTWLHHHIMSLRYHSKSRRRMSLAKVASWEKRLNATQHRYTRAIRTLGQVRKLACRGPLQINIGNQQVNVAG